MSSGVRPSNGRPERRGREKCADLFSWFLLLFTLVVVVPGLTMILASHGGWGLQFAPMEGTTVEELRAFRQERQEAATPKANAEEEEAASSSKKREEEAAAPSRYAGDGTLPRFYGTEPVLLGEEHCAAFRERAGERGRAGAAGLFNTGTNLLWKLLRRNCVVPKECTSRESPRFALDSTVLGELSQKRCVPFLTQVPWGKHNPVAWRGTHFAPMHRGVDVDTVLPVVMVKDPLSWIKSMCRMSYAAKFRHGHAQCCPSPLARTQTEVTFRKERGFKKYESLVHLWMEWNRDYLNFTGPRLVVRYEDLLWRTRETTDRVCRCVGGTLASSSKGDDPADFDLVSDGAKGGAGHANADTTRSSALAKYENETRRYDLLTDLDLKFLRNAIDPDVLDAFRYEITEKQRRRALFGAEDRATDNQCLPDRVAFLRSMGLKPSPHKGGAAVPVDDESDGVLAMGVFYSNPKKKTSTFANYQQKHRPHR